MVFVLSCIVAAVVGMQSNFLSGRFNSIPCIRADCDRPVSVRRYSRFSLLVSG